MARQEVSQKTRTGVLGRDGYLCQRCGRTVGLGANMQHRRARGRGGRGREVSVNFPENLLSLCGSGTTGCHGWVTGHPRLSDECGWSVSTNATEYGPESVPVLGRNEFGQPQWYWLEGFDRIPVPEETAVLRMVALGIRKAAA
ncbi:hypothetical protein SCB71_14580 [Herbiconiux sp. KACC 21604]|uniref:hypothetical protein n=1 Tax=unclassified Herbiconiux TaxID=2618217 RepID=UPI0014908A86|nr:hypothetical protein [Herbiconiux sp. SALV-R1]QJU52193.1 hypothetical protein HL652_12520 [Herbiconiux sp. SALV-R1]WPO85439.1 hypothetical protein SCB71_14580 [Herbiconiux sp. KACC 21604]